MERKYFITQDQLDVIDHYKRMFELQADQIKTLCSQERSDVVYGFELGQIHSHQRECFSEMCDLHNEIRLNQEILEEEKII